MEGVFKFLSFVAIYYVVVSCVDIYGTIRNFKRDPIPENAQQLPDEQKVQEAFTFDFNTDLFAVCIIYLVSYYAGVFS